VEAPERIKGVNIVEKIQKSINLLGFKAKDKVTGITGVITSICFDLYGCIQCLLNPGVGSDGKLMDLTWFDANRLEIISDKPVMNQPDFCQVPGPECKPTYGV
jgi:hypothetical protein